MNKRITLGSLFDGIGGFPLAAKKYGITPVWASEIEPLPIAVTSQHFPKMKHLGDIKNLKGENLSSVDIITGGSPCQDLSIAGNREGLLGKRSNLFLEQIKIIKEIRKNDINRGCTKENIRPRIMVWENVPGAFSSKKGNDFKLALEEICKIADETAVIPIPPKRKRTLAGCIMGTDFSIAWRVLDAQFWGVPQRRRRIYLVADFGGTTAPEILFEPESLCRHTQKSRSKWQNSAERFKDCPGRSSQNNLKVLPFNTSFVLSPTSHDNPKFSNLCHTLSARGHVPKAVIQNCYCVASTQGKAEIFKNLSPTITATAEASGNNKPWIFDITHAQEAVRDCKDICPTLKRRMGTGGNQVPVLMSEDSTYCIDRAAFNQGRNAKYNFQINSNKANPTLISKGPNAVYSQMNFSHIRCLTPLECERLQGFPDYWTTLKHQNDFSSDEFEFWKKIYLFSHKNEPSKKQVLNWKNKLSSDCARYKALGNSLAIPCVSFVIGRIKEVVYSD